MYCFVCHSSLLCANSLFNEVYNMKKDIHPKYGEMTVTCSCGNKFKVGSTQEGALSIEVCDQCDPFSSGKKKKLVEKGRVEQYKLRYETPRVVAPRVVTPQVPKKPAAKKAKKVEVLKSKKVAPKVKESVQKPVKSTKPTKSDTTKTKEVKKKTKES